ARLHDAVIAFEQLVVVEAEIGDALARLEAFRFECRGQALAALAELGISEAAGSTHHSGFASIQIYCAVHAADRRERDDHEFCIVPNKRQAAGAPSAGVAAG